MQQCANCGAMAASYSSMLPLTIIRVCATGESLTISRLLFLQCFYTSSYKSFREKSPSAAPEEISAQIKEAWEALTDEEQKPFFIKVSSF